jgi:hypothetical protein
MVADSSLCLLFAFPGSGFGTWGEAKPRVGEVSAVIGPERRIPLRYRTLED